MGWSGRWPCRVTHGERCNWSNVTPSAMTITPVNTRLNRASAFELRSKTCAMSAFLLPLHYLRLRVEKLLSTVALLPFLCRAFRNQRAGYPHGSAHKFLT